MTIDPITRRDVVGSLALGAAVMSATGASAQMQESHVPLSPAFAGAHQPKPLKFDPAKLDGLSERLIRSHWENNYVGSVKALNMIENRLAAALTDAEFPPLVYGGLKREELHRTGSVVLHEIYFDGLGGDGEVGGAIREALNASFGSLERWEADFRRTGMSLAGGSGWCVLAYNLHTRSLHNHWAWDHMHAAAGGVPLLALDMYEHSYHMDYGTAAAKYVDAFFRNVDWETVDRRYVQVTRMG
jgi:Fe-Mn family superoxide dismutase